MTLDAMDDIAKSPDDGRPINSRDFTQTSDNGHAGGHFPQRDAHAMSRPLLRGQGYMCNISILPYFCYTIFLIHGVFVMPCLFNAMVPLQHVTLTQ